MRFSSSGYEGGATMPTINLTDTTSNNTRNLDAGESVSQLILTAVGGSLEKSISFDVGPQGVPGSDDVVIAVEAAPINGADLLFAAGWFAIYPQVPAAMGAEGAGRVVSGGSHVDP